MNRTSALLLLLLSALPHASAAVIELQSGQMGYYWYRRQTWLGGSDTTTGFSYGDAQGKQHVHRNYQYYGGSDRYWEQKDIYFQIDLSTLSDPLSGPANFHFYLTENNSPAESFLKHVSTQTTLANGDAGQKLAGNDNVIGTAAFVAGWNSIDVSSYLQSDIDNGYSYAAFSIPQFSQVQDQNRILSLYGPSSTAEIDGISTVPFLEVTAIPEPSVAMIAGFSALFLLRRRRSE